MGRESSVEFIDKKFFPTSVEFTDKKYFRKGSRGPIYYNGILCLGPSSHIPSSLKDWLVPLPILSLRTVRNNPS